MPLQDGLRSDHIKQLAKASKKSLRLGKHNGPPVYTAKFAGDLERNNVILNQREKEALDLNFGVLSVARPVCLFLRHVTCDICHLMSASSCLIPYHYFDPLLALTYLSPTLTD